MFVIKIREVDKALFNEAGRELLQLRLFRTCGDYCITAYWFTATSKAEIAVIKPHTHSATEFHYIIEGTINFMYEDKIEIMNKGDLRIVTPGKVHGSSRNGDQNLVCMVILAEFQEKNETNYTQVMSRMFNEPHDKVYSILDCGVEPLLTMAMDEALKKGYLFLENVNNLLLLILNRFAEALVITPIQKKDEVYAKRVDGRDMDVPVDRMNIVDEYINANIYGEIRAKDIAEQLNLCERQLLRLIHNQRGVTTSQYILIKKLALARKMLEETDYTVKEIAMMLGFCDEYYFSRSFKKEEGLSPVRYRKSTR